MQTTSGIPRTILRPEARTTNFIARNISSTCNSSGSAIWASAKNIKPLVDASCHTEAIEQSPIRFPPIHYRNHGSKSPFPSGQTILFGCPLEFCTVGELRTIPPVLKYLMDSVHDWPIYYSVFRGIGHEQEFYSTMAKCWPLANELEKVWTGVEESDRAIISGLIQQGNPRFLLMVCPLLSTISEAKRRCRDTFWPFQSQHCQLMILKRFGLQLPTLQDCLGML